MPLQKCMHTWGRFVFLKRVKSMVKSISHSLKKFLHIDSVRGILKVQKEATVHKVVGR